MCGHGDATSAMTMFELSMQEGARPVIDRAEILAAGGRFRR